MQISNLVLQLLQVTKYMKLQNIVSVNATTSRSYWTRKVGLTIHRIVLFILYTIIILQSSVL